ncbi:hypothetical protein GLOIN_2v1520006 [Rhizophagus irregularis DAOM 181602=DAOM 197198]|uniref:Uncharacterized protein n=1 Tax=Rhizophagus irregularis (strain DAOM 181602 / DAOM 197198 / MUCL 43194) TaxID=747089 RepID=A0A2P4QRJ1_RHIID|nr:hypothetical protein GLOIN_2v1520006 [Rhizophagus irregularis DAOM 181602=DAOM 197198]POG80267.1 hypothetical protein GLOIN_2v1520006 [Rhizophagus irregularis DAOM 181602=DAOM 197198]GET59933.1 hypothetical protein GLOIN_2v1520006 [Rhizophagus irregularis DAOM 181602=DAOM 197198]|eukprot:XP_025187133.1 hypothetical protein GLOIN_2v1520006 [Rhizophagus irregularis DAOM 181602=DAOM 197198]
MLSKMTESQYNFRPSFPFSVIILFWLFFSFDVSPIFPLILSISFLFRLIFTIYLFNMQLLLTKFFLIVITLIAHYIRFFFHQVCF